MHALSDIPRLGAGAAGLLEAAGFPNLSALAAADPAEVASELAQANKALRLLARTPGRMQIDRWVNEARRLTSEGAPPPARAARPAGTPSEAAPKHGRKVMRGDAGDAGREVNFEADPVVVEMLANAPLAIPVSARVMAGKQIHVGDVASGVLLTRVRGDLEIRVDTQPAKRTTAQAAESPEIAGGFVKRGIDVSKLKSVEDLKRPHSERDAAAAETPGADKPPSNGPGRRPESRWTIRGVSYPHPLKLWLGAAVTLAALMLVLPAFFASILLVLAVIDPVEFDWVSPWWLALPLALPVFGVLFLLLAQGMSCKVCTQRLFMPRRCRKHVRAHHVPGMGYILPLAFHIVVFRWFRCMFCGTSVRLKR